MLTVDNNKKFDWANISLADCLKGNAMDAHYTAKIYAKLLEELQEKKLEKLYENLISPATVIFRDMEYDGILIDQEKLQQLKGNMEAKLGAIKSDMLSCNGLPSNPNFSSSQDLIKILYSLERDKETKEWQVSNDFGFGLYPFSKTDKDQPQTNEETLVQLKELVDKEYLKRYGEY